MQRLKTSFLFSRFFLIICAISVTGFFLGIQFIESSTNGQFDKLNNFFKVYRLVKERHPDEISDEVLIEAAIEGLLGAADPFSVYINKEEYQEIEEDMDGEPIPDPNIKFIPFDTAPKQKPGMGIKIVYPEAAREMNITGTVHVQFFIDKKGNVTEAYVAKGMPGTDLDEAALDAVIRSKWYPARQREKKVGVWQTVPIKFVLE